MSPQSAHALGQAIAELYIAAQGNSTDASDTACDLIERLKCHPWTAFGFNQRMHKSAFGVTAS